MILIWKGAGILVAVLWFASMMTGDWVARTLFGPDASKGLHNLTCELLAAGLTLGLGLLLRTHRELRVDPESGQAVTVRPDHSLFFIPVLAWPAIFFALGVAVYYSASEPAPAIIDVTPAAVAKVKQAKAAKWRYVRIVAYWPKGRPSPAYSVELVRDVDRARDYAFETSGIKVVVLKRQVEMLQGAQLDYGKKDGEDGFQVKNPNFEADQLERWRRSLELERPSGDQ